jgi:hypothetical protein
MVFILSTVGEPRTWNPALPAAQGSLARHLFQAQIAQIWEHVPPPLLARLHLFVNYRLRKEY